MKRRNKGQAVAMDIMLVCICISLFTVGIWAFSMTGKAPSSQALRSRQDYAKSLLLTALYTTPDTADPRYAAKSISDLITMHLINPEKMPLDVVKAKMKEAKINEYLKEKVIGSDAEWFLYADKSMTSSGTRSICLHGKSGSDEVEECPTNKVSAEESTAATAEIVCTSGEYFVKIPIFLIIKWS